jgi:hypothetical protein
MFAGLPSRLLLSMRSLSDGRGTPALAAVRRDISREPTSGLEPLTCSSYERTIPTGGFSASLYLTTVATNVSAGVSSGLTNVLPLEIMAPLSTAGTPPLFSYI